MLELDDPAGNAFGLIAAECAAAVAEEGADVVMVKPALGYLDVVAAVRAAVPPGGRAVLLCRSGVRSIAAAKRATELGIEAYNILEGFEGNPDADGHRGQAGGWRFRGLPWKQN